MTESVIGLNGLHSLRSSTFRLSPDSLFIFLLFCVDICNSFTTMVRRRLGRSFALIPASTAGRTQRLSRPFSTVLDGPVHPSTQTSPPPPPPSSSSVFQDVVHATAPRNNWTREEISKIYNTPLMELTYASVSSSQAMQTTLGK